MDELAGAVILNVELDAAELKLDIARIARTSRMAPGVLPNVLAISSVIMVFARNVTKVA